MAEDNPVPIDIESEPTGTDSTIDNTGLFEVELPEVTETQSDFIDSDDSDVDPADSVPRETLNESGDPGEGPEAWRGRLSDNGTPFDPDLHKYPPTQTKSGRWSRTRKKSTETETNDEAAQYRREAENIALLYALAHPMLLGQEAGLRDRADIIPLTDAVERYMIETGHIDIPPEISLLMSAGSYSAMVVQRPTVWQRVQTFFSKLVKKKPKKADKVDDKQGTKL